MKYSIKILILSILLLYNINLANDYYVSINGKDSNEGSRRYPWKSVNHALKSINGKNTIILLPGDYTEQIHLTSYHSGTQEYPTIIKSDKKWAASINSINKIGIIIDYDCEWTIIDGFKITGSPSSGVLIRSNNSKVINCWISHNSSGIYIHNRINCKIENNLIEFNGSNIQSGHGIGGSGKNISIKNNVIRHNASYGIHLFPRVNQSNIINNLIHHQIGGHGVLLSIDNRQGETKILNNTIIENNNSLIIHSILGNDRQITGENSNISIFNNVLISEKNKVYITDKIVNVSIDYNLILPKITKSGPNSIQASLKEINSGWVDPLNNIFLLKKSSPLIGKGILEASNNKDFWNLSRNIRNGKIDIGAFSYLPTKITNKILATFKSNLPYFQMIYYDDKTYYYPDFWNLTD